MVQNDRDGQEITSKIRKDFREYGDCGVYW